MYCLVVGQALGTLKPLVTLGALVEPLLFIGASEVRAPAGQKLIVPQSETCSRGRNQKLNHACFWKIYIAPASEIQFWFGLLDFGSELLAKLTVGCLHVPCKVTSSGFHFSTLLTRCLSFVHCRVVRQTLVGSEGLFTEAAVKLLGLRIPIISSYRNNSFSTWLFLFQFSANTTSKKKPQSSVQNHRCISLSLSHRIYEA